MGRLMRLTIAARRSDLARIQAYLVGDTLRKAHPEVCLDYSFHESLGDRNQMIRFGKCPRKVSSRKTSAPGS